MLTQLAARLVLRFHAAPGGGGGRVGFHLQVELGRLARVELVSVSRLVIPLGHRIPQVVRMTKSLH